MKKIVSIFVLLAAWLWLPATAVVAADSAEALAIRAVANADRYSPRGWYLRNVVVQGAPQSLMVDGYEAVRDGRTVYVAGANVASKKLYTNIYIISYNQQAETDTTDIFGQILKYWKFNTDIAEADGQGFCRPDLGQTCNKDQDCRDKGQENLICRPDPTRPSQERHCLQTCWLDADCGKGAYCDSQKAKIRRDVKRMADLAELKLALDKYSAGKGAYPALPSGSYMAGKTISVWPSWNETLGKTLGYVLPKDPVNRLGACPGFDTVTCWNEGAKKFATNFLAPVLPVGSLAYLYTWDDAAKSYRLCTNFETNYDNLPSANRCDAYADLRRQNYPELIFGNLTASTGAFNAYVSASSLYPIVWSRTEIKPLEPASWAEWQAAGWSFYGSGGLRLQDSPVPAQKKISARSVKLPSGKSYQYFRFGVRVYDNLGQYGYNEAVIRICNPRVCQSGDCGQMPDNCGSSLICGQCQQGQVCVNNRCVIK